MAAQDELMLLERVFLRIGSAETDEQLETTLGKFLCPVLKKLESQADGVRKKVMELLVHINKRVKSRPKILLPVDALLAQYTDPESSPFVTNFTILYIKIGYPRMARADQASMLPQLMKCVVGKVGPQQISLLQLIIPALQHVEIPTDTTKKNYYFQPIVSTPSLQKLMLDFMMDTLCLPYNYASHVEKAKATQTSATGANAPNGETAEPKFTGPPPAMSETAMKNVTGENPPTHEELEKIKTAIVNIIGAGIFPEENTVCHLIIGTADTRHSVANAADRELKRIISGVDFNHPGNMAKLFSIFQGTVVVKGKQPTVKPADKRTPASVQMRMKIIPYFLKSKEAANQFPACIQIVFDCLYGANSNAKLKMSAIQFVHHLCFHCTDAKFKPIGPVLLSGMVKVIGDTKEDAKLRSLAYLAVGKLSRRSPQLVTKDIALLQTFFNAMCLEESDIKMAVQEALSMMSESFKCIEPSTRKLLEALIMENIEKPQTQNRLMAVQYANTVFPRDHIPSRYVLLLACGDLKDEIYEEASKGLKTLSAYTEYGKQDDCPKEPEPMPNFPDMVNYIHEKATERLKTSKKYVTGNHVLAFNPVTFGKILMYLRMCLAANAGMVPNLESMEAMKDQAPAMAGYVKKLLGEQPDDKGPISVYIGIIRQLLTAFPGAPAMYCLLEIVAIARERLAGNFVKHMDWIKNFMFSSKEEMRVYASEMYGLIVATSDRKRQADVLKELISSIQNQAVEGQHGALLGLGNLLGYTFAIDRAANKENGVQEMETDADEKQKVAAGVARAKAVNKIVSMLSNSQSMLVLGACSALGEIGRNGALPLPNETTDKDRHTKLSLVNNLLEKVQCQKDGFNPKIRAKAAVCLGYICIGEDDFPYRKKIIEGLLESAAAKQFELHMTIGEALVMAAEGPASPAARDMWLYTEETYKPPSHVKTEEVVNLLHKLLGKYSKSPNPHIRQAACIWLVALVKQCGAYSAIQKNLMQIQSAFMGLLGENDEITQDIASKGLGIVYEKCSKEQKDELVSALVSTLTTGKKSVKQDYTSDTEVFQEGAIGKTPDGQNLSTYKELCSIANDLNQPDLIYKFMHLANHQAAWNNKKGAAFGFGTIAAQAGEQLAPYLHQILPKMYRYQFDPNPRIQQAMTSIWNALVSDNKNTVDKYMKQILDDLIVNLTSTQWRVRESSCLALNDLLRGRPLDDIVDQLPTLWETCFRVRDDIKESVRNAAEVALKSLSRASIKVCDRNYGKVGAKATSLVLPCLLQTGLGSTVQEVRAIGLAAIVKISKNAGDLLKPHIPLLSFALLESLSTLEPQYLNYVALHAASNEDTQEKLDNARIAATKTSPMMEVINLCVPHVDDAVLAELIPRISDLIRGGIGLGTKVGCANFLVSLISQHPRGVAPYAGKILGAMLNGLNDRNVTVRKSYAVAIGTVAKVAKESSVEKLIIRIKDWYMEKEESGTRQACGLTLAAIGQKSPDVLKQHGAAALPLAFLAMHETSENDAGDDKKNAAMWEETWMDATPGTEAGVRLYLTELIEISQRALDSQSWHMKAQGAAAMSTIAKKLSSNLKPPHLGLVLSALLKGLSGRTWAGKESLLQAIDNVAVSCKDSILEKSPDQPTIDEIIAALMKEAKKENLKYKMEALKCLTNVLDKYDIDCFKDVTDIIYPFIKKGTPKDDKVEASGHDIDQNTWLTYKTSSYESLGKTWPKNAASQSKHQKEYFEVLSNSLTGNFWKVELQVWVALKRYISRLTILEDSNKVTDNKEFVESMLQQLAPPLCLALGNVKYSSIRCEAIGVLEEFVGKLTGVHKLNVISVGNRQTLRSALENMPNTTSPDTLDKASELVKLLPMEMN